MIDQKEMSRISRLYQRYNSMNRPQGNGDTECLICNCNFGLLAANPRICSNCLKVKPLKQLKKDKKLIQLFKYVYILIGFDTIECLFHV